MIEKTLLQKIREKELEISVKIESVRRDTEQIILNARREAAEIIAKGEEEGKRAAEEYYRLEKERIDREIEEIRRSGSENEKVTRERGEQNIPRAIEIIEKKCSG
jgi:vacuolar-type H+-ATPase subunit H